jgi:hypothetical protein
MAAGQFSVFTKLILWDDNAASARQAIIFPERTVMDTVCPNCNGNAFLLTTGSDGRTMTICTKCDYPVPSDATVETALEKETSKHH